MLVKTTKKHAMLLQTPPVGRYKLELKKVIEKPNKKGDGTNLVYSFEITEGDFQGKPFDVYCSMGHDFGLATALQIHQAITGDTNDEAQFDPEEEIGGLCIGEIDHELYQGNKQATIKLFLPLKNALGVETPLDNPF